LYLCIYTTVLEYREAVVKPLTVKPLGDLAPDSRYLFVEDHGHARKHSNKMITLLLGTTRDDERAPRCFASSTEAPAAGSFGFLLVSQRRPRRQQQGHRQWHGHHHHLHQDHDHHDDQHHHHRGLGPPGLAPAAGHVDVVLAADGETVPNGIDGDAGQLAAVTRAVSPRDGADGDGVLRPEIGALRFLRRGPFSSQDSLSLTLLLASLGFLTLSNDLHCSRPPVWRTSYPNSGTSYTMMTLVERASNRSTATDYGDETTGGGRRAGSRPRLGQGPF
jgi:hypothetical protein